ncbi:MAG: ABC transporter ATP-binding protein [Alicyclobacillus herbarius]|uniref:ABC transporter ATP-binding protein n=1 Tax=Alicyclobacillus herbarius TaxID=122960 RepID=UPI0023566503|nr:ABC transporter ATP-binding protein [Alicyclobacillus herbarius]MCL6632437.1 ABC transporter ATP-binding protein [Alicyclobacillus herbarius]
MSDILLDVRDLTTQFRRPDGVVYAVNGVSFQVRRGETLGIVGESGSGKSVSVLSILGLIGENGKVVAGTAEFEGVNLLELNQHEMRAIRGREIGVVFQDPMTSLNPIKRVGEQVMEAMLVHRLCSKQEARQRAVRLLEEVGISDPERRMKNYPFELSGGMRQRVMIAIALACQPRLLIADEPTTALDVTVQMQVLSILREAQVNRQMSTIMITHDLGVATNLCDRIIVMYGGKVMESAPVEEFIRHSAHPYSRALKSSILEIGSRGRKIAPIPGNPPVMIEPPRGCPFADRCPLAIDRCRTEVPDLRGLQAEHFVACHRAEEVVEYVAQ